MRPRSESFRQILRHLAAARFYLPVSLDEGDGSGSERQYNEYLHHSEFGLALDLLEDLGCLNSGYAEESLFWGELACAADLMEMKSRASSFLAYAQEPPQAVAQAANAFLSRQGLPGVTFEHNTCVEVVAGPHKGATGSLVALHRLKPEPSFTLESTAGNDLTVLQRHIRAVGA